MDLGKDGIDMENLVRSRGGGSIRLGSVMREKVCELDRRMYGGDDVGDGHGGGGGWMSLANSIVEEEAEIARDPVGHWLGYAHDAYRRVDKVTDLLNEYIELKYPNGIGLDEDGFLLWAARQCYQEAWSLLRSAEELARLASVGDSE